MRKKLVIDGNSMVWRTGMTHLSGIGRTTFELVSALQRIDDLPFDVTIFTQTIRGRLVVERSSFRHVNLPVPPGKRFEWMLKKLPMLDILAPHDLLHIPHNYAAVFNPSKTVVTIHDALYFSYPENFLGHEFARVHYPPFARACRAIITCSENSKKDIVEYMGVLPEKVTVAHWGVNRNIFYPSDKDQAFADLAKHLQLNRPFFVSVSCDRGRKNTITVMRAFRLALKQNVGHDLALVWGNPPEEYLKEFAPEIESGRIRFVAHVDDETLRLLYTASTLSWFLPWYEGSGLPILESMACGTPVVTCRNSSLVEVGSNAALYVDPDDVQGVADLMIEFDKGWKGYDELADKSQKRASGFTWDRTAGKYAAFYAANL